MRAVGRWPGVGTARKDAVVARLKAMATLHNQPVLAFSDHVDDAYPYLQGHMRTRGMGRFISLLLERRIKIHRGGHTGGTYIL
jgi:hypothetical protein